MISPKPGLLSKRNKRNVSALLVGAAIGSGLAARAAVRGGCDFLLALNAGKLRSMGAPSIASLLPLRDSNALVMEFGPAEILTVAGEVPVFFGASAFDPRQKLEPLVKQIASLSFQGITNFPTSTFLEGDFRERVDRAGVGFNREIELLEIAHRHGLMTLAYVGSKDEAKRMAQANVDIINLDLGWNTGGQQGVGSPVDIAEAGDYARSVFRLIRRIRPETLCMIEGGPIVSPQDMNRACETARADGYIGGSTIDRLPLESAIEEAAASFKMIGALQVRVSELERQTLRRKRDYGLVGMSEQIVRVRRAIPRLAQGANPILITGPAGSGKEIAARAIATEARRRTFVVVPCDEWSEESLFGAGAGVSKQHYSPRKGLLEAGEDTMLYLDDASRLPVSLQHRLLAAIETGYFLRLGDNEPRVVSVRFVFAAESVDKLDSRLRTLLSSRCLNLPALVERLEDISLLTAHFLKLCGTANLKIDPSVHRALMAHTWPGNIRELRAVVERAATSVNDKMLTADRLPLPGNRRNEPAPDSERNWILDALRRHSFRRRDTAAFLGISRKTLYNKMQSLGIATKPST